VVPIMIIMGLSCPGAPIFGILCCCICVNDNGKNILHLSDLKGILEIVSQNGSDDSHKVPNKLSVDSRRMQAGLNVTENIVAYGAGGAPSACEIER
jgi:hypothetical protein